MKKIIVALLLLFLNAPLQVLAIAGFMPVGTYGFTNDRAMWEDDTLDANDNDTAGDVAWFYKEPQSNMILPHAIYIGSQNKFNRIAFAIGNSPLQGLANNPHAVLRFSYPQAAQQGQFQFVPLEVKDLDGGFSRSNQTYRYSFSTPHDWVFLSPHVATDSAYFIKVECLQNCSTTDAAHTFEINEVNVRMDATLPARIVPIGMCALHPLSVACSTRL